MPTTPNQQARPALLVLPTFEQNVLEYIRSRPHSTVKEVVERNRWAAIMVTNAVANLVAKGLVNTAGSMSKEPAPKASADIRLAVSDRGMLWLEREATRKTGINARA